MIKENNILIKNVQLDKIILENHKIRIGENMKKINVAIIMIAVNILVGCGTYNVSTNINQASEIKENIVENGVGDSTQDIESVEMAKNIIEIIQKNSEMSEINVVIKDNDCIVGVVVAKQYEEEELLDLKQKLKNVLEKRYNMDNVTITTNEALVCKIKSMATATTDKNYKNDDETPIKKELISL